MNVFSTAERGGETITVVLETHATYNMLQTKMFQKKLKIWAYSKKIVSNSGLEMIYMLLCCSDLHNFTQLFYRLSIYITLCLLLNTSHMVFNQQQLLMALFWH